MAALALAAACDGGSQPPPRPPEPIVVSVPGSAAIDAQPSVESSAQLDEPAPEPKPPASLCERYVSLYEACEPKLAGEIAAGNRLPARSERAQIEYNRKLYGEAMTEDACRSMLPQLERDCARSP